MVTHYRTQGFVFKREDRQEADRMFTLFTRDFGRVEVAARAIRKITSKLRGGIEMFSLTEIEFIESSRRNTLIDALAIEKFSNIFESPEKIEVANRVSLILQQFIKGQESDQRIWDLIEDFFGRLNALPPVANLQFLHHYFFWNFISILGYAPNLLQCTACDKKLEPVYLYFSYKEGGIICAHCSSVKSQTEGVKITSDLVKILRIILSQDGFETMLKLKIKENHKEELEKVLQEYCNYLV